MAYKAIFLDRDDTLIHDPGYISDPGQVRLIDGVAEALAELKTMGYKLVVVSNQSAVARGIVTEQVLAEIHDRLRQLIIEKGTSIDGIYYCPYHPDGVIAKYRRESDSRKPNPGMLLTAASEMDIILEQSWMLGNGTRDVEAGRSAGCKTILIDTPLHNNQPAPGVPEPDFRAVNMREAVNIIKKHHRLAAKAASPTVKKSEPQPMREPIFEPTPEPIAAQRQRQTVIEELSPVTTEEIRIEEPAQEKKPSVHSSEEILRGILDHLKSTQRDNMFGEFSIARMFAVIVQVLVFVCLLISLSFLIIPARRDNEVFIALGFAMVLQVMALTFYMMQGRK